MRTFSEGCGKIDSDLLPNSMYTCGRGVVPWTGLDTGLLAMPGGVREFSFDGTVFGFSLGCNLRASL